MLERFEDFTYFVSLAYKYIIKIKTIATEPFGLRASHVMCLYRIGQSADGLTAIELSERCHEDKAGISKALSTLREAHLVSPDGEAASKKYRARWLLTEEGDAVYRALSETIREVTKHSGSALTDEERSVFYTAFRKITDGIAAFCEQLTPKKAEI